MLKNALGGMSHGRAHLIALLQLHLGSEYDAK